MTRRPSLILGRLIVLVLVASSFAQSTQAETQKRSAVTANVTARIVVEAQSVAPGDTVTLLLDQSIREN
jgi:hypothetical protein